jgi:hypothetical protein
MTQHDDDIIPITRGQIKRLALARFLAEGIEQEQAHDMAKSYADRFLSHGEKLDRENPQWTHEQLEAIKSRPMIEPLAINRIKATVDERLGVKPDDAA